MPTTTRRSTTARGGGGFNLLRTFTEWVGLKGNVAFETDRMNTLRDRTKEYVMKNGEEDENGSFWVELPEPVEHKVTDKNGKLKTYLYTHIKAQRSLTPATPLPVPEKAEALLRKKKLWLTPEQEKQIRDLAVALPYAFVSVSVDVDAVTGLVFRGLITDKEYEATLAAQTENFSFVPTESA